MTERVARGHSLCMMRRNQPTPLLVLPALALYLAACGEGDVISLGEDEPSQTTHSAPAVAGCAMEIDPPRVELCTDYSDPGASAHHDVHIRNIGTEPCEYIDGERVGSNELGVVTVFTPIGPGQSQDTSAFYTPDDLNPLTDTTTQTFVFASGLELKIVLVGGDCRAKR